MDLRDYLCLLDWCEQQKQVQEITLLGGEPSLHPRFSDMVTLAAGRGFEVRVVTNGARSFRRLVADKGLERYLSRVAISLDSVDEATQDQLRGRGALRDATDTINLVRARGILFDVNVTAVTSVLPGIQALINYAESAGSRRVNIHWPSAMGLGRDLPTAQIPTERDWRELTSAVTSRTETRADFFVEVERGFLAPGQDLAGCALEDTSNLQILPDGRAYRCGLLVDRSDMASLFLVADSLLVLAPDSGEERLRKDLAGCDSCPAVHASGRRACIFDKVSSIRG